MVVTGRNALPRGLGRVGCCDLVPDASASREHERGPCRSSDIWKFILALNAANACSDDRLKKEVCREFRSSAL